MTYIDLFAGAGGLSEGFIRHHFEPVAHVEMDAAACRTLETRIAYHELKKNGKQKKYEDYLLGKISREKLLSFISQDRLDSVIQAEINDQSLTDVFCRIDVLLGSRSVDVIAGGPPCQAYSLAGRSRDPNRMRHDKRNTLFRFYAEFLKRYKPKYFVFENVKGLLTAGNYFREMIDLFESPEVDYRVDYRILNAADFGVLQKRERVIIIGRRGKKAFKFPELEKVPNNWQIGIDLFADLPPLKPGDAPLVVPYAASTTDYLEHFAIRNGMNFVSQHEVRSHNPRDRDIYRIAIEKWHKGERLQYDELPENLKTHRHRHIFTDRFKVVNTYGSCHTLVAHIAKDGHYYIHPDLQQARSVSVREAARIQSFPDDFFFEGGRTAAWRQVGNAVPPLLAEKIAGTIKALLISKI
jgi:DNA (cytosine-5)-methyltransferase 1